MTHGDNVESEGEALDRKPVIGIAGLARQSDGGPFLAAERVFTGSINVRAILKNGGLPLLLPAASLAEDARAVMACCDGLLLPGGEDLTPWYYGEEPLPCIGVFRPEIDAAWMAAVRAAAAQGKPILGICKGHQTINVAFGGSLFQDMSLQERALGRPVLQHMQKYDRTYLTHHVQIDPDTHLAAMLGAGRIGTNSMHHQAVNRVAEGFRVTARADDGTVEAIENGDGSIIGVQWHPEDLVDSAPRMNALFAGLIARAAGRDI